MQETLQMFSLVPGVVSGCGFLWCLHLQQREASLVVGVVAMLICGIRKDLEYSWKFCWLSKLVVPGSLLKSMIPLGQGSWLWKLGHRKEAFTLDPVQMMLVLS